MNQTAELPYSFRQGLALLGLCMVVVWSVGVGSFVAASQGILLWYLIGLGVLVILAFGVLLL